MTKTFTFLLFLMFANLSFAQTETPAYKSLADSFERNYNSDNYKAIFASFSSVMRTHLPLEKTKDFVLGQKNQYGKITNREFVMYDKTYGSYKTTFEKGLFFVNISVDDNSKINGLFIKPFTENSLSKIERNTTKLQLPFKGEWTVTWGGDTKELNYHVESIPQKNAFDLLITNENGKTSKTDGSKNEDYYAFGKELISPCDGEVVLVVDG
ncbi:MAG TPA: DUF3887 domain-containing protein [Pedobacter sp.]